MTTFLILFAVFFASVMAWAYIDLITRKRKLRAIINDLTNKGYKPNNLAEFLYNIVGVNVEVNKLCIADIKSSNVIEYDLSALRDYEILKDGVTIIKKSNVVGRAVIGGLFFGGLGAIAGVASSESTAIDKTKAADLKIYTNDIDRPSILIKIFDKTIKSQNQKKPYLDAAQTFIDKLAIIIK